MKKNITHFIFVFIFLIIVLSISSFVFAQELKFKHTDQKFKPVRTYQAAFEDLDNDGDKDAVFTNMGLYGSQVFFNDGTGNFLESKQKLTKCGHGIGIGDVDNDGDSDLVITCAGWEENKTKHSFPSKIYFNDGKGYFTDSKQNLNDKELSGTGISLVDIDADNDLDFVVTYYKSPDILYLNDGTGNFQKSKSTIPENVTFGDLNLDGTPDMFLYEKRVGYRVKLNDGVGKFTDHWSYSDSNLARVFVSMSDLDNDNDLDIIV